MKYILFSSLAILVLLACQPQKQTPEMDLGGEFKIFDPADVDKLIEAKKITPAQRKTSLESLKQAFRITYIGYDLKKSLIGKSGDEIFEECLSSISDESLTLDDFYGEVRKCLAGFKDTHLYFSRIITSAPVTTPIASTLWIDGKLVIGLVRPKILQKLDELQGLPAGTHEKSLYAGAEIVEINGASVEVATNELGSFVPASSELYRKTVAAKQLFTRNYHYPKTATVKVKVRGADNLVKEFELPWIQSSSSASLVSSWQLQKLGAKSLADFGDPSFLNRKGFGEDALIFQNLENSTTYLKENNKSSEDVLTTGMATLKDRPVCYLSLSTFDIDDDGSGIKLPVYKVTGETLVKVGIQPSILRFLKTCEDAKRPLVLDLRANNGGNAALATNFFSMFENNPDMYLYSGNATANNAGTRGLILNYLSSLDPKEVEVYSELMLKASNEAIRTEAPVAPWVLRRTLGLEAVFSQKVLVLSSSQCISACDNTIRRFKTTGRGIIVGEPSNGTGFGFASSGQANSKYRDPFNLFEMSIPTTAFQSVKAPENAEFVENKYYKGFTVPFEQIPFMENKPSLPDVEVAYTLEDFNGFKHYLEVLGSLL